MSAQPDWATWALVAAVAVLFLWFFWFVATTVFAYARQLVGTIQNWPQIRRAMVEAEAQAGGRYPLWYRAARVTVLLGVVALAAYILWRRFG